LHLMSSLNIPIRVLTLPLLHGAQRKCIFAQSTRQASFSKYFMWIIRSGQEHCAKCLDPFLYQGPSGPEVADSDSDHMCVDDKPGSASPATLAERDPYGNPEVVEEMFALRAVHRRAMCHHVPAK